MALLQGERLPGFPAQGDAARAATGPLNTAAAAADRLAGALSSIHSPGAIRVSVTGVDAAIAELNRLNSAINSIDTSITIQANVVSTTTSSTGTTTGGGPKTQTTTAGVAYYETYNVYNPLAAAMLVQQKRIAPAQRLEAVMNG